MSHDTTHTPAIIDAEIAQLVSDTMQALATPSRVLILAHLRPAPMSVGDLAAAVNMEPSAVSHQLRVLRHLGLVTVERIGRTAWYELHDDHVAELVDQAIHHTTHRRLGLTRN